MQGKIPYKVLQINSTFHGYMEVTQVIFQPQDSRFYFQPHNPHTVLLKPQEASIVSMKLLKICLNDCLFSYCIGSYWKTWLHEIKEFLCTSYLFLPFHQLLALVCMYVSVSKQVHVTLIIMIMIIFVNDLYTKMILMGVLFSGWKIILWFQTGMQRWLLCWFTDIHTR